MPKRTRGKAAGVGKMVRAAGAGGKKKGQGPRSRIAKLRASGNKKGAYSAIRKMRKR